jgi:hypothetical protein
MSYTFTSNNKNYANNEAILHSIADRDALNNIFASSKSVLMVGWRYDSDSSFVDFMINEGKDLTIVEIYEPNTKTIRSDVNIVCSDILDYEINKPYDLLLWQHGPEHVFKSEVFDLIKKIKDKFKYIVLETPYGANDQGEMYGNIYEAHVSEWTEQDYEKLGMNWVKYAGADNNAFIIAYK